MLSDRSENANPGVGNAEGWLGPGRFGLLLTVLIVACFPQVVAGWETFFFRDYGAFTYPLAFFHREAFWRGELPFWNPLNNCGLPFLAQWNTLTLYPGSLIYLLLPLPWGLGMFCLLHMLLAGLGAWFLALRWTGNRLAAAVAGVAFAFNGLTWYALMWTNNIAALGWMPWVVLAVEEAWQKGGARRIALGALTGAMQMLAGAPEVIMLTWCALGALWLAQFIAGDVPRARLLGRFALVTVLVPALAAAQLLPFLQLLSHSQRDTGFGDSRWAMPLTGLGDYLVPLFRMQNGPYGPASQADQYWTSSYYPGVGTVALALLAAWRWRNRRTWVLVGLVVFSLFVALGDNGHVYTWLRRIAPPMGFMRFPIKFVVLATFAIPFLAAQAVAGLELAPAERWAAERRRLVALGFALIVVMGALAAYGWTCPKPADAESGARNATATLVSALSRGGFLAVILGCVVALRSKFATAPARRTMQGWLQVGLLLLLWWDVFTHSRNLSPTVPTWVYGADTIRQYYHWGTELQPGVSRAMPTPAALMKVTYNSVEKPANDFNGRRLALFADYNVLDHAAKVNGFYSLYLREESALLAQLYSITNGLTSLKDFLGVSLISHPTNTTDWVRRDTFMPMITAGQEPVFAEDAAALQHVASEKFEPRRFVYLSSEARAVVNAKYQPGAKVLSSEFSAQHVRTEVDTPAAAMLVVAQAFYQPWRAYVDEKPVRLWRANYAFQALEVPAGRHQIKLVYEDRAFRLGVAISVVAWAGCLGALCRRPREPRISSPK
jgi:Bacterial membrane protein YfhO